jgi:hypothetical protein
VSENCAETHQRCRLVPARRGVPSTFHRSWYAWYDFRRRAAKNLVASRRSVLHFTDALRPKWRFRLP